MSFFTEDLKVGDKVICRTGQHKYVGEVVNKTSSGMVDVKINSGGYTVRYRKNGDKFGKRDAYEHNHIIPYTAEEEKQIMDERRKYQLASNIRGCDFYKFGLEALELIWKICEKERADERG